MAMKVSGSTTPPPATSGGAPGSPSASSAGVGGIGSSIASMGGVFTRTSRQKISAAIWYIPSHIGRFLRNCWYGLTYKIWGVGRTPPVLVEVVKKGWLGGLYVDNMSLVDAIEGKYPTKDGEIWTPEYALKKGGKDGGPVCDQDTIRINGWHTVKYQYDTGIIRSVIVDKEKRLRDAVLVSKHFTWEQAIDKGFISRAEAEKGGWVKKADPKATKK